MLGMFRRLPTVLIGLGIMTMVAAWPVSIYISLPEIWTQAGYIAGTKCMLAGTAMSFTGLAWSLVNYLFRGRM